MFVIVYTMTQKLLDWFRRETLHASAYLS